MSASSSTPLKIDNLDKVIHERARLGIMSMLAAVDGIGFVELKRSLELTDGNLSVHLRILEEAGYVGVEKSFADRKPRTEVSITRKGRAAFKAYVDVLDSIVRQAKK